MSRRSVQPNSFCVRPADFGRADPIEWVQESDQQALGASKAAFNAARTQHRIVLRIRARIWVEHLTIGSFARKAGISEDFAGKVLLGVKRIRVEDIEAADLVLGEMSDWSVRNREKLATDGLNPQQLAIIHAAVFRDRFIATIQTAVDDLFRG